LPVASSTSTTAAARRTSRFATSKAEFADWVFTKDDYFHDSEVRPNLKALQNNLRDQKALDFLKIDIDVEKYADLSLVDEAAKRPR